MLGKVKWWNDSKGFGLITDHDGVDLFCHYTSILSNGFKTLSNCDVVEFDVYERGDKLEARNVRKHEQSD